MIFINNKYTKLYYSIIDTARSRTTIQQYTESHHIIPKSLGGDNSRNNLVRLTAREHYICHRLLPKMTSGDSKRKMSYAIWSLVNQQNTHQHRYKINSRTYKVLREDHKQASSISQKGKPGVNKGKKFSEETKQKMSESAKKRGVSPQARDALIASRKGKPPSNKGKPMSQEQKEKCREAALRRWQSLK